MQRTEKPARTAWCATFLEIMVLPRPLVPISARLRPSRTNSRVSARSMRSRSIFLGQFQSKSAMGLKRPMRPRCSRPWRLRRVLSISSRCAISSRICAGDQRPLVARARKSSRAWAIARRPTLDRRATRSVAFVIVVAQELIVVLLRLGFDVEVLEVGTAGEIDRQGGPLLGGPQAFGQDEGDRAEAWGLPCEGLLHSSGKLGGPVVVEQEQELLGGGGNRFAPLETRLEEGLGRGNSIDQSSARGGPMCPALLGQQGVNVCGILDLAVAVVAPPVASDFACAIEDADRGLGRNQAERTAHGAGRDRVVVEIEADVDGLVRPDRGDEVGLEGMDGQRQKVRRLLLEGLGHGLAIVSRPAALPRHLVTP